MKIFCHARFLILVSLFVLCRVAHGQIPDSIANSVIPSDTSNYDSSVNQNDIEVTVSPENPGAFTTVTVTLDSNLVDLRRYTISWFIDGQSIGSGIGKTTLLAKTNNYGQTTHIRAAINLLNSTLIKDISLTPQDITMFWEAINSYAPPFYEGKKLPSRESLIKIATIPNFQSNGTIINPSNAVYSWKRNGSVIENASSYGNDSIVIKQNKLRSSEQVEVSASDIGADVQAIGTITVPLFNPKVLFYSINPLTGIKSPLAQTTLNLSTPSIDVVAEPYNFSVLNNNPNSLSLSWTMNHNPITISNVKNQTLLSLQNPGTSGVATIGLSVTNPRTLFQDAESSFSALFNQ
jgi:hypothetical protein